MTSRWDKELTIGEYRVRVIDKCGTVSGLFLEMPAPARKLAIKMCKDAGYRPTRLGVALDGRSEFTLADFYAPVALNLLKRMAGE